jgi:hypothetical protein
MPNDGGTGVGRLAGTPNGTAPAAANASCICSAGTALRSGTDSQPSTCLSAAGMLVYAPSTRAHDRSAKAECAACSEPREPVSAASFCAFCNSWPPPTPKYPMR